MAPADDRETIWGQVRKNAPYEFQSADGIRRYRARCSDSDRAAGTTDTVLDPGTHNFDLQRDDGLNVRLVLDVSCADPDAPAKHPPVIATPTGPAPGGVPSPGPVPGPAPAPAPAPAPGPEPLLAGNVATYRLRR